MLLTKSRSKGRPPGPEMENAVNRESYSLAAGLALGLVMLEVFHLLSIQLGYVTCGRSCVKHFSG